MSKDTEPRIISVAEMAPHVHSFLVGENKVDKISKWLISWIEASLKSGKIKPLDFLPAKGDLAFHIGVSKGTIQNAFRLVEDYGLIESKQRIGTFIKGSDSKVEKLTSKREQACESIKKYLIDSGYRKDDVLIPIRRMSLLLGISPSTIRAALNTLEADGILLKSKLNFVVKTMEFKQNETKSKTLVNKVAEKLKQYIKTELKTGDKLPSNTNLAKKFNVSIKTIHDAIKVLSQEGILYSRRGYYGTVVINQEAENVEYFYETAEAKIKYYIINHCETGDKLPAIRHIASMLDLSTKTIKKALDNMVEEGYITITRGRYGGAFVMEIPSPADKAYTWLAINPNYISTEDN